MAGEVFDFSDFLKYKKDYENLTNQFDIWLKNFIYEMAERVIARTKGRTPVDSGALRNAWQFGEITQTEDSIEIEILNGMDYASYVEYGTPVREWKWKDGALMVTISMDEIYEQMPVRFDREFRKLLKRYKL